MTVRVRVRFFAIAIALCMMATACGAEQVIDSGDVAESTGAIGTLADGANSVPSALDFLGDVAQPHGTRTTTTLDDTAASVSLEDDASVVVEAGAFTSATELTTQVVDLDFSTVLGDSAPWSRAYVVSTVSDVSLGAPVTIEIPRPAAELRAIQIIDGETVLAEVLGDQNSARIEIPHFSEVVTLVLNTWGEQAAEAARVELARISQATPATDDTPANFLRSCLGALLGLWGGYSDAGVDEFYSQLTFSMCTNALIARSAPDGKYVSTACVGDRISGGLDFQPAVDACAADSNDNAGDADSDSAGDETDPADLAPETVEEAEVDAVPEWTYVGLFDASGFGAGAHDDAFIQIVVEGGSIVEIIGGATDYVEFADLGPTYVTSSGLKTRAVTQSYVMTITVDEPLGLAEDVVLPISLTETGESDGDYEVQYPVGVLSTGTLAIDFQGTMAVLTLTADGLGQIEIVAD